MKSLDVITDLQGKSNTVFPNLTLLLSTLQNSLDSLLNSYLGLGRRLAKRSTGMYKTEHCLSIYLFFLFQDVQRNKKSFRA